MAGARWFLERPRVLHAHGPAPAPRPATRGQAVTTGSSASGGFPRLVAQHADEGQPEPSWPPRRGLESLLEVVVVEAVVLVEGLLYRRGHLGHRLGPQV